MLKESVRKKLFDVYGPDPAVQCLARLEEELARIPEKSCEDEMLLINKLREASDCEINPDFFHSASFVNWLATGTNVNPLPPHYYCPVCGKTVFLTGGDAWDLPVLACCGRPLVPDGHNIPFESVSAWMEDPRHQLTFQIPRAFAEKAVELIKAHYAGRYRLVPCKNPFSAELSFALVPVEAEQPLLDENDVWEVDSETLYRLKYRTLVLRCTEEKARLKALETAAGVRPELKDLLTKPVLEAVRARLRQEIAGNTEPTEPFEAAKPPLREGGLSFSLLVKMAGYRHAMYYEDNPALAAEGAGYADVFTCREDVWELVSSAVKAENGVGQAVAARFTDYTRKGRFTHGRMGEETELLLKKLGISDHWITQMKYTAYLPAKAVLIEELLDRMRLAWYEQREASDN